MFGSDDWDNDFFKPDHDLFHSDHDHFPPPLEHFPPLDPFPPPSPRNLFPVMELVVGLVVGIGAIIIVVVLCRCCCRKSGGRVLAPPPAAESAPAPYPQQQYNASAYPVATTVTVYPTQCAAPYAPGPAPYPAGPVPYPGGAHAPFPTPAPYPGGAPYVAPYPAPYPHAPTAPDVNACPPSYEQVMQHSDKQPPYNPHVPH